MVTLMVGVLLVAASAVGFGLALFGRRPVPQPAMSLGGSHSEASPAEPLPSIATAAGDARPPRPSDDPNDVLQVGWWRQFVQREPSAGHQPGSDVTLSPWIRARSALFLALIVAGLAALIGIVTSIVLVGAVLLIT